MADPRSIDPKALLRIPLELALSIAVGLATGAAGAAATTYSVAYSIRNQAVAEMRQVVKESMDQDGKSRDKAMDFKVDRAELVRLLANETARRDRQYYEVIGRLQTIETLMRRGR